MRVDQIGVVLQERESQTEGEREEQSDERMCSKIRSL